MRIRHILVILGAVAALLGSPVADASAESRRGDLRPWYYLSLGTSLAVGIQPDAGGVNQLTDEATPISSTPGCRRVSPGSGWSSWAAPARRSPS